MAARSTQHAVAFAGGLANKTAIHSRGSPPRPPLALVAYRMRSPRVLVHIGRGHAQVWRAHCPVSVFVNSTLGVLVLPFCATSRWICPGTS